MKAPRIALLLGLALVGASTLLTHSAHARPQAHARPEDKPAQPLDKLTQQARERFIEGITAYDAGNFDDARISFLQAYALKRHPAVLLNLGQSELKSGNVEEGGNHLNQFLRENDGATAEQRKAAQDGISEARKKAAFVIFIVDTDGATVGIDGQIVGTSPLGDPVFVRAGEHEASAAFNGKVEKARFSANKGSGAAVTLNLRTGESSVAKVAPAPAPTLAPALAPTPTPTWTPTTRPTPTPVAKSGWDTVPVPAPGMEAPPMAMFPDPPVNAKPAPLSFGRWFKGSTYGQIIAGAGAASLVVAIVGIGVTANADGAVGSVSEQILSHASEANDVPDGSFPCGPEDEPSKAHENYTQPCQQLRDNLDARDTGVAVMATGLTLTALSAAGLVFYYFEDRKPKDARPPRASSLGRTIAVTPVLAPAFQGATIVGTF
ncbi:MAG: hypothetical protein EXR75_14905 [Myxococcales bacterium]|nr:hypothetical protein [Myxococcales bacterium]